IGLIENKSTPRSDVTQPGIHSPPLALTVQVSSPQRGIAVNRLRAAEACQRCDVREIRARARTQQVTGVLLEMTPRAQPTELESAKLEIITDTKLVLLPADIGEWRKLVSARVEQLYSRKRRTVLHVARVAEPELNLRLGQQNQIVILQTTAGIA